jgi:pyruvate dehydrogenase E1 component alpha subunit
MLQQNWADQAYLDREHDRIRDEVDAAIEWAEQSPFPDPSELLNNVYEKR